MHEVAAFLRGFPPFDQASEAALDTVVAATEIEFFAAGDVIFSAGGEQNHHAHVIRAGHVELLDNARVIELIGPGDMAGLPSLVSGLPPGLDVRAAEDVLTYRIPAEALLPLLSGRSGLRFVARTVRDRTAAYSAERLVETTREELWTLMRPAVVMDGCAPVHDLVDAMHAADASCALVRMGDGTLGIVTDHDLRARVLAPRLDLATACAQIATAPVRYASPEADADDAVMSLLAHGIRHLAVVSHDEVLGYVEDVDLLAAQSRTPVRLRRAVRRASTPDELVEVAAGIIPSVLGAMRAGHQAVTITASLSTLREAVVTKAVELHLHLRGAPPVPFAWVTTGSVARGEAVLSSDLDSLVAWDGPDDDAEIKAWMRSFATEVLGTLDRCGNINDSNGMRADDPRFSRSVDAWRAAISAWADDPMSDQADIYLATLVDARASWGHHTWNPVTAQMTAALARPHVRTMLSRLAVAVHPPTGFVRDLVIEGSGEHAGTLDLKHGGATPCVTLGRYVSVLLPGRPVGTVERMRAAATRGLVPSHDCDDLLDAFEVIQRARLHHQRAQVERGEMPDDHVRPDELGTLERRHLRDAFRVVRRTQHALPSPVARP